MNFRVEENALRNLRYELAHPVGRLGAVIHPRFHSFHVYLEFVRFFPRVVMSQYFKKLSVARGTDIRGDYPVKRSLLGSNPAQSYLDQTAVTS